METVMQVSPPHRCEKNGHSPQTGATWAASQRTVGFLSDSRQTRPRQRRGAVLGNPPLVCQNILRHFVALFQERLQALPGIACGKWDGLKAFCDTV